MGSTIRLAAKEEGLDFHDGSGNYRLNAYLDHGTWYVEVPGSRSESGEPWYPSEQQREAISAYLSKLKLFGLIPRRYRVEFVAPENQ